jgi:hypothetical protein
MLCTQMWYRIGDGTSNHAYPLELDYNSRVLRDHVSLRSPCRAPVRT